MMRREVLYGVEIAFLLLFWAYMFRYVKPGLFLTIAFFVLFAVGFTLIEARLAK